MHKHLTALILVMGLALCGFAQTTNTFPSTGNAGIGITSPLYNLDILAAQPEIRLQETATGSNRRLQISVGNENEIRFFSSYGTGGNYPFTFRFGGSTQEVMRIATNGYVGIGTAAPQSRLDVQVGGVSISGTNAISSIANFRNALQLKSTHHAAIVYNPGDSTELMFGFHNNGNMYWGSKLEGYSMILSKTNGLQIVDALLVGASALPGYKLSVDGKVAAKEVNVTTSGWADYVFQPDYQLLPLDQLETHINAYGHLPGIPNATEVAEKGIDLGEMNRKLLEKVEELTLHAINQQKLIAEQNELINAQQTVYTDLLQRISKLENQQDN